jgi:cleavage and polyadenylation specificity factor subunit 1
MGDSCQVVPENFQKYIFFTCAKFPTLGGSPPGGLFLLDTYVWRGLAKDVAAWAKTCLHCQQSKIHCHARTQPLHIPIPQWQFSQLHIDLVGP